MSGADGPGDRGAAPGRVRTGRQAALRRLPAGLRARRAWPHAEGLAVEARAADGAVIGVVIDDDGVRLLPGADPALPALRPALACRGAVLLAHRPGRRAVVREADGHYLKVVRPGRSAPVAQGLRRAAALLAGRPGAPAVPTPCAVDDAAGWVRLDPLPGPTLHALLRGDPRSAAALCGAVAGTLAALRGAPAAGLVRHTAAEEVAVLSRWLTDADARTGGDLGAGAPAVTERLLRLPEPAPVPCHRDLHDKQVLATAPGTVGLLDLDTLCAADPALDPANLLAHLRLRVLQGWCPPATARRCLRALGDGLGSAGRGPAADPAALAAYTASALLRLAAVYTFRPGPPDLPARLAAAAAEPDPTAWTSP